MQSNISLFQHWDYLPVELCIWNINMHTSKKKKSMLVPQSVLIQIMESDRPNIPDPDMDQITQVVIMKIILRVSLQPRAPKNKIRQTTFCLPPLPIFNFRSFHAVNHLIGRRHCPIRCANSFTDAICNKSILVYSHHSRPLAHGKATILFQFY